jgi:Flp pilus assembly protein TadG
VSRASRGAARGAGERGSVTVEIAIALPAVLALLAFLLGLGGAVVTQVRCADGARAGARAAALGLSDGEVAAAARQAAGGASNASVSRSAGAVTVTVTTPVRMAAFGLGPEREAKAAATSACEPTRGCG